MVTFSGRLNSRGETKPLPPPAPTPEQVAEFLSRKREGETNSTEEKVAKILKTTPLDRSKTPSPPRETIQLTNGQPNGQGTLQSVHGVFNNPEGGRYLGGLVEGKFEGFGIYTWPNGDSYYGPWEKGLMHGRGTFICANKEKYIGDFKDNARHGKGTLEYSNGDKYEGDFKLGKREGRGIFTYKNGDTLEGVFLNNELVET